jgi:hypothetical protein
VADGYSKTEWIGVWISLTSSLILDYRNDRSGLKVDLILSEWVYGLAWCGVQYWNSGIVGVAEGFYNTEWMGVQIGLMWN